MVSLSLKLQWTAITNSVTSTIVLHDNNYTDDNDDTIIPCINGMSASATLRGARGAAGPGPARV